MKFWQWNLFFLIIQKSINKILIYFRHPGVFFHRRNRVSNYRPWIKFFWEIFNSHGAKSLILKLQITPMILSIKLFYLICKHTQKIQTWNAPEKREFSPHGTCHKLPALSAYVKPEMYKKNPKLNIKWGGMCDNFLIKWENLLDIKYFSWSGMRGYDRHSLWY